MNIQMQEFEKAVRSAKTFCAISDREAVCVLSNLSREFLSSYDDENKERVLHVIRHAGAIGASKSWIVKRTYRFLEADARNLILDDLLSAGKIKRKLIRKNRSGPDTTIYFYVEEDDR